MSKNYSKVLPADPNNKMWSVVPHGLSDNHVIPNYDTKGHVLDQNCWCVPVELDGCCFSHNAADGREQYETGHRKRH